MNITTSTWLPVFPGFYGTFFDGDNEYDMAVDDIDEHVHPKELAECMIENMHSSKAGTKFWKDYTESTAKQCVNIIEAELKSLGFITEIKFEEIVSPKEYNFRNDSINIEVTFSAEKIRHFISEHFAEWKEYLKETYTSYDGFMSHHSNEPGAEEWFVDNALRDSHNAGSVLEFLCGENNINTETLYYGCNSEAQFDYEMLEKECIEKGWYVPNTRWNRFKARWADSPKFQHTGLKYFSLDTKKQTYIFAITSNTQLNPLYKVKRIFKIFVFARLVNGKSR